jgi:hypothetical protein
LARIDDRVLGSVIYLYRSKKEAEEGHHQGGTGFLVSVQSDASPDYFHVYAVSNKHVVQADGYAPVVRTTAAVRHEQCIDDPDAASLGLMGNREVIVFGSNQWKAHDEADVAITYLGPDRRIPQIAPGYGHRFSYTIPSSLLITRKVIRAFDVGPGDDVYMCGRFIGHPGVYFNEPSVRWGTISLMHSYVDLEGKKPEEVFLVEMRSLSGFSGSPVTWRLPIDFEFYLTALGEQQKKPYPLTTRNIREESGPMPTGPWLLGIDCGSFPYYSPVFEVWEEKGGIVKRKKTKNPKLEAKTQSGVAAVVPAWKLRELLDLEEFRMMREKEDRKLSETKEGGRFDRDVAVQDED